MDKPSHPQEQAIDTDLLAALEEAQEFIKLARHYFPKSIKNPDRYRLELTSASISKVVSKVKLSQTKL